MPRKLRVEYTGAFYHVMNRGDRREGIFADEQDRWCFPGPYISRFNRRHREFGHLLSGRYKALLVDGSGDGYLKTVCDYVHLNPAGTGLVSRAQRLSEFPWSSYSEYLKSPSIQLPDAQTRDGKVKSVKSYDRPLFAHPRRPVIQGFAPCAVETIARSGPTNALTNSVIAVIERSDQPRACCGDA